MTRVIPGLMGVLESHREWLRSDGQEGSWANLPCADLSRANLSRANLSWANLSRANLSWANLSWANLSRADLSRANLSWANLSWANLSRANLSRANLSCADLSCADLSGADLSGANLSGAALPTGGTLADYREEITALAQAGGKTVAKLAEHWDCHHWENCPMAHCFDVRSLADVPLEWRLRAAAFAALFDGGHLTKPEVTA